MILWKIKTISYWVKYSVLVFIARNSQLYFFQKKTNFKIVANPLSIYQSQYYLVEVKDEIKKKEKISPLLSIDKKPPYLQSFGFKTRKEYEYWCERICAIACVKMVLNYFFPENTETMAKLVTEVIKRNGYDIQHDKGWFHSSLIKYFKDLKLYAGGISLMTWGNLIHSLKKKKLIIVSVNDNLMFKKNEDAHMIIVTGFYTNIKNKGIYFLDPANFVDPLKKNMSHMSWFDFCSKYNFRGILVRQKKLF